MIKRTKIVIKYVWGWGVFCDSCGAQLTRHRPKRKIENLKVRRDHHVLRTQRERAETKARNEAVRAAKKARGPGPGERRKRQSPEERTEQAVLSEKG